jgi:hypothetical protein
MFIFVQESPPGHLQVKLREIDIPVKREWLTPELCRLRVSEDTTNHQKDCGPGYFQLKPRLAIRHERFVRQIIDV